MAQKTAGAPAALGRGRGRGRGGRKKKIDPFSTFVYSKKKARINTPRALGRSPTNTKQMNLADYESKAKNTTPVVIDVEEPEH